MLKKSIAYICAGSTRKPFKPSMILEVMPKIIVSHVAEMIQEFRHVSILALRRLTNFIRLFGMLIELYPEVQQEIEQRVKTFIEQPEKRVKDHCSSLGDLHAILLVCQKFNMDDLLGAYLQE